MENCIIPLIVIAIVSGIGSFFIGMMVRQAKIAELEAENAYYQGRMAIISHLWDSQKDEMAKDFMRSAMTSPEKEKDHD